MWLPTQWGHGRHSVGMWLTRNGQARIETKFYKLPKFYQTNFLYFLETRMP